MRAMRFASDHADSGFDLRSATNNNGPLSDARCVRLMSKEGDYMTIFRCLLGHAALVGLMALPTAAQATTRECRIKPTLVATDRYGMVFVSGNVTSGATGSWNWVTICNANSVLNSVSPAVCGNWYAALLSAQATGKTIHIYYDDANNNGIADCATFPGWVPRIVDYLGPVN